MLRALHWEKDLTIRERISYLAQRSLRPAALTISMFLMMHLELPMRASPLAAALLAAGLGAGQSAGALVAGFLLGLLRLPLENISLLPAFSCALVLAAELLLSMIKAARQMSPESRVSMVAGFSVLLPALLYANGSPPDSLRALACAALAATTAPFLAPALALDASRTRLTLAEKTGAVLLICACLAGIHQLLPPLGEAMAMLLVLLTPGLGTVSGALCGVALCFGGGGILKTASLALCALAGGLKICRLRWQRALMVCGTAAAVQAAGSGGLKIQWVLCAAGAYLLLPEKLVRSIQRASAPARHENCNPDRIAREITAETRHRLRCLGDAFSAMAEGCTAPTSVPDEQELICQMRSRLCAGCASYEACWAGENNHAARLLCSLIGDALDRVDAPPGMRVLFSDGEIPPGVLRLCRRGRMIPDRLGLLLRDFAEKRRSEIKRCATGQLMSVQFTQARELLYNLAERQAGTVSLSEARLEQMQAALQREGLEGCEIFGCNPENPVLRIERRDKSWNREEIAQAVRTLNRATGYRLLPRLQENTLRLSCAPRLTADTGSSCRSGVAGEICGDSHMIRMLDASRLMLALSDGMGCGEAASDESLEALRLLWRFLEAGISRPLALETVNQQLLMRSSEDMFATIDLCIIDLNTGIAEMTKLSACRTLILRGKELIRIEGGNLPLGILEGVQPSIHRVRLRPGDVLIMGSDGVMETGDALLIERLARENAACSPQQLAENLVRETGMHRSSNRRDDLTCICARMEDGRKAG